MIQKKRAEWRKLHVALEDVALVALDVGGMMKNGCWKGKASS